MRTYPETITRDNGEELFSYLCRKTKKNRRLLAIRRVILPIGCILFVALSVLMTLGAFSLFADEEDAAVFNTFPLIAAFEGWIAPYLAKLPSAWYVQAGARVLTVFLAPVAVSCVLAILASVFHKRSRITKPEGTTSERAKGYHQLVQEMPRSVDNYGDLFDENCIAAVVGSFVYTGLIFAFLIYGLIKTPSVHIAETVPSIIGMAICAVIVWFVYAFLMWAFIGVNGVFYAGGDRPYDLLSATEKYWLTEDKDEATRRRLEEDAARLRKQQKENEYISACAKWYAEEQKEHEEYLQRLHEWATSDDDVDFTGYGDGI